MLEFLGVEPGWTVLDLFAGNGYYSEVIADVGGDSGIGKPKISGPLKLLGFSVVD